MGVGGIYIERKLIAEFVFVISADVVVAVLRGLSGPSVKLAESTVLPHMVAIVLVCTVGEHP